MSERQLALVSAVTPDASACDVLLVEDHPSYVVPALRALHEASGNARTLAAVADGTQALERLFGATVCRVPRLVILGTTIPGVSAAEVLRCMRAEDATRRVPVVMLGLPRLAAETESFYALGANSYVVRPRNFPAYLKAMTDIVNYWLSVNESPPALG
jgi:two-component system, response regulator